MKLPSRSITINPAEFEPNYQAKQPIEAQLEDWIIGKLRDAGFRLDPNGAGLTMGEGGILRQPAEMVPHHDGFTTFRQWGEAASDEDTSDEPRLRETYRSGKMVPAPRVDAFLDDLKALCIRHGFVLEPGDVNGGMYVQPITGESDVDFDHIGLGSLIPEGEE